MAKSKRLQRFQDEYARAKDYVLRCRDAQIDEPIYTTFCVRNTVEDFDTLINGIKDIKQFVLENSHEHEVLGWYMLHWEITRYKMHYHVAFLNNKDSIQGEVSRHAVT